MTLNSTNVYTQANAGQHNPQTPGLNSVIDAWQYVQDFFTNGAANYLNQISGLTDITREI